MWRRAARAEEIALGECCDTGQALRFMSKAALRGAANFRFFADRAPAARDGQALPSPTLMNITTRVPVGPVGIITPWNTPFMLSTWKIAPALAAGCTVVHKPAEFSPWTARILMDIAEEAGLPPGVWNLGNGTGEDAGRALTEHPDIRAIAFVGESKTGAAIMAQGAATLNRVHIELGGKNPVVVIDDADLATALEKVEASFATATAEGATIAAGGTRVGDTGQYVAPTLFTDATNDMSIARDEIFGPVLTAIRFTTEDEALAIANDTPYGLTGYVWTSDITRAMRFTDRLEAGMIWVNSANVRHLPTPFGGMKASGIGRDGGDWSFEFYMEQKHIGIATGDPNIPRLGT